MKPSIKSRDYSIGKFQKANTTIFGILKILKDENDSKEVAITYSLDSVKLIEQGQKYIGVGLGAEHDVDSLSNTTAYCLIFTLGDCGIIVFIISIIVRLFLKEQL